MKEIVSSLKGLRIEEICSVTAEMIKTFLVLYIFTIRQNFTNFVSLYIFFFTLFNKLNDVFNVTGLLSSFCVHDEVKRDIHFNYITVHQMSL